MPTLRRVTYIFISLPFFLLILWIFINASSACCKHIGNVGPTGGGVGLWGYVYLDDTPIENAIVTISRTGEDVVGCVYWGNGSTCPQGIGVGQAHIVEDNPYYAIDISGLIDDVRDPNGLPTEPVDLMVRVNYTDPETQIRYEASEVITVKADDFNEYKEVRLDISLYPTYSNGSGIPVPADFILLENTTVQDNLLKLAFDGLLQNTQTTTSLEQMKLNQRDYAFEAQGDSYLAYNPAQQLHLEVTPSKFKLLNQSSDEFWAMEMEVEGANLAAASSFLAQANTLSNPSQTYVNQEQWVEYSLTLPSNASEKVVKIALNPAGLTPALVEGKAQLNWQTAGGEIALQSSWFASDEQGNPVLVELSLAENGKFLLVKLPPTHNNISLSSYWTRGLSLIPDWVLEGEQAGDWFGQSVNSAGDVNGDGYVDLIVGAPFHYVNGSRGKIYVYYGEPNGFSDEPSWTAIGNKPGMTRFGAYVNTAGDINGDGYADILVSDSHYSNGEGNEGLVVIYFGSANGLGLSNREPDGFIEGNIANLQMVEVGPLGNVNGQNAGKSYDDFFIRANGIVYVFYGGSQFDNMPDWSYPDEFEEYLNIQKGGDINGDSFDDVLVAGKPSQQSSSHLKIFWGSDNGLSDENHQYILIGSNNNIYPRTANDINNDGFADVFVQYTMTATVNLHLGTPTGLDINPVWNYQFQNTSGNTASLAGDINGDGYGDIFIPRRPPNHYAFTIFHGSSNGLLNVPDFSLITNLGTYVRTSDDVNNDGYSDIINGRTAGGTYIGYVEGFYGKPHPIQAMATQVLTGTAGEMGRELNTIGDVTGDNQPDLAISAPHCRGQAEPGRVHIYAAPVDLTSQPTLTLTGSSAEDCFGMAVIGGLDINQDHYQDLILGAPGFNNGQGQIYIYYGIENGLNLTPVIYEGDPNSSFGSSLTHAGDLNGDGYTDWVVGSPNADKVTIFLGNANFANFTQINLNGPAGSLFGSAIVGGKDVNGDGFSDILVGAPSYTNDQQNEGGAWLYTGSPHTGINTTPIWHTEGNWPSSQYGSALALADLTGDGLSDVVVGDFAYNVNRGRLLIYYASPVAMSNIPAKVIEGVGGHQLGYKIYSADLNHDGWLDLVTSAPSYTNGQANEGAFYIYYGSSNGLTVSNPLIVESNTAGMYFGQTLAVGDLNTDGFTDVVGGSPAFNNYAGQVQWFSNNGRGGGHLQLQQITADGHPLTMMGLVNYQDGVGCTLEGSPLIIGDKRELICEFAPVTESFGGPNTVTSTSGTFTPSLLPGTTYKGRARWIYHAYSLLGQRVSPWFTPAWNGLSEADFQTTVGDLTTNIIAPAEVQIGTPFTIEAQSLPITTPLPINYSWQISLNNQPIWSGVYTTGLTNTIDFTPTETGLLTIQVQTENSHSSYLATKYIEVVPYLVGTAVTQLITPTVTNGVLRWDTVRLVANVPPNTTLQAYVLDSNQNLINCVSPTYLSDGENYLPISCINPAAYPAIHIGFTLTTNQSGLSPAVSNWSVRWLELDAPLHRLAGQAKDGYGNVLVNATASLYISNTLATTTSTDEHGWYDFAHLTPDPNTPYAVRVTLQEYEGAFQIQELENEAVYLESPPLYLAPQTIFTTKVADVNFQRHQTEYTSNVSDPSRLDDLAIMYHHSYEALTFIHTELQEPNLAPFTLKAFDPALSGAEYEEETATIFIGESNSWYNNPNRPMNREWHEIFHHLMVHTVGFIPDASVCTPSNPFQNHGGYWNACTSDSWSEGWAEFWATALSKELDFAEPGLYLMAYDRRLGVINLEVDHPAWEGRCNLNQSPCYYREEFAVASTLWDLYDDHNDNRDQVYMPLNELWAVLKQGQLHDMKDVYGALVTAEVGQIDSQPDDCELNDLDEIFVAHGFFHDENEDKIYQCSEEIGRAANGLAYPRSDRRAAPPVENSIEILSNAPVTMPITVSVQVTFEEYPEWNYSYEALVVGNSMYIEPPTIEYLAQITVDAYTADGRKSQNPLIFTNEEYWELFAQSGPGDEIFNHIFEIRWFGYLPLISQ